MAATASPSLKQLEKQLQKAIETAAKRKTTLDLAKTAHTVATEEVKRLRGEIKAAKAPPTSGDEEAE